MVFGMLIKDCNGTVERVASRLRRTREILIRMKEKANAIRDYITSGMFAH